MSLAKLLLAVCLLAACAAPPLPEDEVPAERSSFSVADDFDWSALGAGDRLLVQVLGHPELSTTHEGTLVDADGRVALPLVGTVQVAGLAPSAAGERVEAAFARYLQRPAATVTLLEPGAHRIWVLGQVTRSGPQLLDQPTTALQALSLSGGFLPGADRESVCVLRKTGEFIDVHLFDAETPGHAGLVAIRPGDVLFVRRTGAGTFSDQVLPIIQGIQPALSSLISLGLVADALND
jgi:polysaccharide export outer membrane protein